MIAQTPAITLATSAAPSTRPTSTAWPALDPTLPPTSADILQPAEDASQSRRLAGEALTLIRLDVLAGQAAHCRNLRQSKAASIFEGELRDLRLQILKRGRVAV